MAKFKKGDLVVRTGPAYLGVGTGTSYVVEACDEHGAMWLQGVDGLPSGFAAMHFELKAPGETLGSISQETDETDGMLVDGLLMAPKEDPAVNLPSHYKRYEWEPIRVGVMNFGRGILVTKIHKYIMRAPFKHPDKGRQDHAKAFRMLEMLADFDAGDPDWWMVRSDPARRPFRSASEDLANG